MTFPSGSGASRTLDAAVSALTGAAHSAKSVSTATRTRAVNNSCTATELVAWMGAMATYRDTMDVMSAVPGIGAYAQAQYSNAGFDIVSEYATMRAAIDAARAWVVANFPKAGTGELLERTLDASGRAVSRVFTAAQLAPFTALLDALIASID